MQLVGQPQTATDVLSGRRKLSRECLIEWSWVGLEERRSEDVNKHNSEHMNATWLSRMILGLDGFPRLSDDGTKRPMWFQLVWDHHITMMGRRRTHVFWDLRKQGASPFFDLGQHWVFIFLRFSYSIIISIIISFNFSIIITIIRYSIIRCSINFVTTSSTLFKFYCIRYQHFPKHDHAFRLYSSSRALGRILPPPPPPTSFSAKRFRTLGTVGRVVTNSSLVELFCGIKSWCNQPTPSHCIIARFLQKSRAKNKTWEFEVLSKDIHFRQRLRTANILVLESVKP